LTLLVFSFGIINWYIGQVVFVDLNPRALQFTRFNALLNGLEDEETHLTMVQGSLYEALTAENTKFADWWSKYSDEQLDRSGDDGSSSSGRIESVPRAPFDVPLFDVILANPPYLPVTDEQGHMYGAGGATGEHVLSQVS
jgi:methylase of polypeptide subunit release factors